MIEDLPTLHTLTGLLPSVNPHVPNKVCLFNEGFPTLLAFVRLHSSVNPLISNKEAILVKHFPAFFAFAEGRLGSWSSCKVSLLDPSVSHSSPAESCFCKTLEQRLPYVPPSLCSTLIFLRKVSLWETVTGLKCPSCISNNTS